MDNSKPENLQNLENVGENLLKNVIKRWNVNTFKLEEVPNKVTNEVNLKRMAKILYEERKRRLQRMANRKIQPRGTVGYMFSSHPAYSLFRGMKRKGSPSRKSRLEKPLTP
ncbi:hypothetical protein K1719_024089 [Acacia pycnantha]|nr:hypothetical protein K1719_024089 [Acacia pycnantha]